MDFLETKLDLGDKFLYFDNDILKPIEEDVLKFISDADSLKTDEFIKKVMLRREIKTNNLIEGILDDLSFIDEVIKNKSDNNKEIINLYKAYKFILTNKNINKETLKELYAILSNGLLTERDLLGMGEYYRCEPVYIYRTARYDEVPYMGLPESKLDYYMNLFFEYVNQDNKGVSNFIKSQIMHFYFVYIHPYFDVNGRCSRTVSLWYLLNKKEYPFILFNRAISFNRREYIENIILSREGNITPFLKYMLINIKKEFEKEYVINTLVNNSGYKLNKEEFETLCYFLSIPSEITIKDFATIYNRYNNHKSLNLIYLEKLKPLIEKNIILLGPETNSYIDKDTKNRILYLNTNILDIDYNRLNNLDIKKYVR